MAELTATELSRRLPVGDRVIKSFSFAAGTGAQADEYIVTGFSVLEAVLGYAVQGDTTEATTPNFKLNAQGTASDATASNGDLGFESAGTPTFHVTVLGRP